MNEPLPNRREPRGAYARRGRHSAGYVGGEPWRRALARVLQVTGEITVTLGVLLGLLVVWELFWTDIGAGREQDQIVAALDWDAQILPIRPADDQPGESPSPGGPVFEVVPSTDIFVVEPPPVLDEPEYTETFATMYVPRWGRDYVKPISEGISRADVLDRKGIGHYPTTAMPGELGNFSVAAHRTTYARPFWDIDQLKRDDRIVIRTADTWYIYAVTDYYIEAPTYVDAIAAVPRRPGAEPDGRYLTLTTCHPKYSARERYIVHAELVYWAHADSGGVPIELVPDGATTREAS